MNKEALVEAIAERANLTKTQAKEALNAFTETVVAEVAKGESIQLVGFGTFELAERSARTGRNPQTGEVLEIPATKSPKFKAGKSFKDAVK